MSETYLALFGGIGLTFVNFFMKKVLLSIAVAFLMVVVFMTPSVDLYLQFASIMLFIFSVWNAMLGAFKGL